jgi:microcystin-dependent protein
VHTMTLCPFGLGDGSTTFNLPNMKSNVAMGYNAGNANGGYYGQAAGEATHVLTTTEIPAHTHGLVFGNGSGAPLTTNTYETSAPGATNELISDSAGGGGAHNNIQPFLTLLFIVKT